MTARYAKIAMTLSLALFAGVVTFTNITDYGANFQAVRHVMSMDTTFGNPTVAYRAVTAPWAWHAAYAAIIAGEGLTAVLFAVAGWRMWRARGQAAVIFRRAKAAFHLAVLAGFLIWFVGFMVVGGEWFLMWQSETWNFQQPAFRFYLTMLAVAIYVNQPDAEPE